MRTDATLDYAHTHNTAYSRSYVCIKLTVGATAALHAITKHVYCTHTHIRKHMSTACVAATQTC
jgi:hypothetical protein